MNKKAKTILTAALMIVMSFCVIIGLTGCTFVNVDDSSKYLYTLSITNKDDLTADWIEASGTRELEVEIKQGGNVVTDRYYQVGTTDSGVISVGDDNKTLTAAGGGTATVTVTFTDDFGNILEDSVEITVIPYLRGVSIANKEALQEVWIMDESTTARTVEIAFNPEYYDEHNPTYTVTSSNPSVIEVGEDNETLTAKAFGTATITVTADTFSDSVVMTVRPALESLTITNEDELSVVWNDWTQTREIEIALTPSEYYTAEDTDFEVSFSVDGIIQANGLTLTAKKVGTVTVTVSALGLSDIFTVEVERSAPVITLTEMSDFDSEEGVLDGIAYNAITIPTATAKTCDGKDISITTEVKGNNATLNNGKLTAPKGTYTVVYTAVDSDDDSLVTEKEITVNVWRSALKWKDNTWQWKDQYAEDEEQILAVGGEGLQAAAFNVAAGQYYYAEAVYYSDASYEIGGIPGMAHYIVNADGGVNTTRWLSSNVWNSDGYNYEFIDFDTTLFATNNGGAWTMNNNMDWLNVIYSEKLATYRGLNANTNPNEHKIAIVRMGDWFINFWNDQYVIMATNEYFANENTIPGLFVGSGSTDFKITGMTWITGKEQVEAKVAELTHNGKDVNTSYVPFLDWGGSDSLNTNNRNFTSYEVSDERGLSYDYTKVDSGFNGGMVSNYVWFDGDFTYEWDYLNKDANMSAGETDRRMILEIRSRMWYMDGGIQFGAQYNDNGEFSKVLLNVPGFRSNQWWETPNLDASEGIHFVITRKLHSDYAEYTMIVQSINTPDQYHSRTITISADPSKSTDKTTKFDGVTKYGDAGPYALWNDTVTVQWHNTNVTGEYSNIKWSNSAYEHEDHIYGAVSYSANAQYTQCTATRACIFAGCTQSESETVAVASEVTTQKDCTTAEMTTYTATFTKYGKWTKTIQTAEALGHDMITVAAQDPTETNFGWSEYKKCQREGCNHTEGYVEIPKLGSAPTLTFENYEEGTVLLAAENKSITLPNVIAISCDKDDLSEDVEITVPQGATIMDNAFTAPQGTYEIIYTVVDTKYTKTTTKSITVTVTRDPLINLDGTWSYAEGKQYVADSEQVLVTSSNGYQTAAFNVEAGKYYYAEVVYELSGGVPGMAHYIVNDDGTINGTRWLSSNVWNYWDGGSDDADSYYYSDYGFIDFDTTLFAKNNGGAWTINRNQSWLNVIYSRRLDNYRGLKANENPNVHKIAIVRIGDWFINFWNDQYVIMATNQYFANENTIPGLFVAPGAGFSNLTVSGITWITGEEAVNAKFAELTHNYMDLNTSYVPFNWAKASLNTVNSSTATKFEGTNFTTYAFDETNGLRYTYTKGNSGYNDGLVSNSVWFDGDFTYEWDYEETYAYSESKYDNRMWADLRSSWWYTSPAELKFGAQYESARDANNKPTAGTIFNTALMNMENFVDPYKWFESNQLDASKGLHFKISRKLHADYAEIIMTTTSINNPNQAAFTRTVTISSDPTKCTDKTYSFGEWNKPMTLLWHNMNVKGKYTNITWTNSAE